MKTRVRLAVTTAVVIALLVAVLATVVGAVYSPHYIEPTGGLEARTLETGSPYAFTCYRQDTDNFYKILTYLEKGEGEFVEKIEIHGYYYLDPEGYHICYALWVPDWLPTGKYTLKVVLQGHKWVYLPELGGVSLPWGPWCDIGEYAYPVTVLQGDYYPSQSSGGLMSIQSHGEDNNANDVLIEEYIGKAECQQVEGLDSLTPAQREVLLQTLKEEMKQKGLA